MKPDSPSPAAHLVRYGVATSRGGYRGFLRHAWMQMEPAQDAENAAKAMAVFEAALAKPDTQFPLGTQPWAGILARGLRRVARLFADESLALRFTGSKTGAAIAPVLNAFAPMCSDMDQELETSGFEIQLGESEASVRERLCPFLPAEPVLPQLGAPRVWLPELFSGMMHAAIWREIVAEPSTLKLAATSAAEFFAPVFAELGVAQRAPSATTMEQMILTFAPKAVEYGLGQLAWMMEPDAAAELETKALPFLRAAFSRETPPSPVVAPVLPPPVPGQQKPAAAKATPPKGKPSLPPKSLPPKSVPAPASPKREEPVKAIVKSTAKPAPEIPTLKAIPKPAEGKEPPFEPIFVPDDDEDEEEDAPPQRAFRYVRWLVAIIGGGLVIVALLPFISGGGVDVGSSNPAAAAAVTPMPDVEMKGPERMVVQQLEPLPEPTPVIATPAAAPRLFEQAQNFIDAAARAKTAGDNRLAAENLSRALLIFKEEFGEQRWRDQRYMNLRVAYRTQLGLLEVKQEQIDVMEDILGAREPVKSDMSVELPGLEKMVALFARGDEELTRSRPKAAAEAYELGLRSAIEVLGEKLPMDRTYQRHLSRYIDFLINENLEPDELHRRLSLVKAGKKPGPLPDKKPEPELDGLGLPKLQ